ncbi:MAG: MipA/OmpV family protein [Thalassotalea sp.]
MHRLLLILLCLFTSVVHSETAESKPNTASKITTFSQQLGLAAISIPENISAQHSTKLSNYSALNDDNTPPEKSYKRSGHWFYHNEKTSVWLGRLVANNNKLNGQFASNTVNKQGLNAAVNYGRFSMETALITENNNVEDSGKFYLQGAYTVLEKSSFNIAITAKVETLSEQNVNAYFGYKNKFQQNQSIIDYQARNTTLGVVGTYDVTPKWSVIGAFTSTMLDKDIMQSPLVNENNVNMALIGTSYAF